MESESIIKIDENTEFQIWIGEKYGWGLWFSGVQLRYDDGIYKNIQCDHQLLLGPEQNELSQKKEDKLFLSHFFSLKESRNLLSRLPYEFVDIHVVRFNLSYRFISKHAIQKLFFGNEPAHDL